MIFGFVLGFMKSITIGTRNSNKNITLEFFFKKIINQTLESLAVKNHKGSQEETNKSYVDL